MMSKILFVLLLAVCGAANAVVTTYAWSINWETSPDEAGQFEFDDLGRDVDYRARQWGPPHYSGTLPSSYGYFAPWFVDNTLMGLTICDERFSYCHDSSSIPGWGYTKSTFHVHGPNPATRARFDASAGCTGGMYFAPRCFTFEAGQTTFGIVAQIPEPETYALMLFGLGLIVLRFQRHPSPHKGNA